MDVHSVFLVSGKECDFTVELHFFSRMGGSQSMEGFDLSSW